MKKCIIGTQDSMVSHMIACIIRSFDTTIFIKETKSVDELYCELDDDREMIIILDPYTFSFDLEKICLRIYSSKPQSTLICICKENCNKFFGLRLYRCGVNCIIGSIQNPNELLTILKKAIDGVKHYPTEIVEAIKMREHITMSEFCSALTARELELLSYLMDRRQTKFIAATMGIRDGTVWSITNRIITKLGVATKEDAIKLVMDTGVFGS